MATFNVSTRADKDSAQQQTKLTIDFTGATQEVLQEIATSAIVVKWQAGARKNGIPAAATIKAIEYRPGTRLVQQFDVMKLDPASLTPEQRRALIAKLSEGDEQPEEEKNDE